MLNVLLIGTNILLYTLQTLLFKMYADRYTGDKKYTSFVYSVICGALAALVSLAFGGFSFEFNLTTFIFGLLNAITFPFYYLAIERASEYGPYSIVMVFSIAGGIAVPTLISFLAFGETVSVYKLISFAVIFVAGYFVTKRPGASTKINNKGKFFLYAGLLVIANGLYGGLINLQHGFTGEAQKDEMLIYTFGITSIINLIFLFAKNGKKTPRLFCIPRVSLIFLICAVLCSALAVNMLVLIASFVDVNLLWTFNNSGVLVFSVIASAIFFKERLSLSNIIGCTVIAVALVFVSMF